MIKIVAIGLVCVAGVGAIAAATSMPASVPISSVAYPAVAGNKSDRLSLASVQDIQPRVEQLVKVNPIPSKPSSSTQMPQKVDRAIAPDFTPRHWHDPRDVRPGKPKPERAMKPSVGQTRLAEAQDCKTDGLGSLMRKLNLRPACT